VILKILFSKLSIYLPLYFLKDSFSIGLKNLI
jgi:hypothetical protein